MPLQPNAMSEAVARNLPAKTGKTMDEWVAIVRRDASGTHRQKVEWLKKEHGLGHSTASIIVHTADTPDDYVAPSDEQLLDALFAGPKAELRPV